MTIAYEVEPECCYGWKVLLAELFAKLEVIAPKLCRVYAKSKFAELRVYVDGPLTPAADRLIAEVCERSKATCMCCGADDAVLCYRPKPYIGGLITLCYACRVGLAFEPYSMPPCTS